MRLAAEAAEAGQPRSRASTETQVFFVTLTPKAEYLSEEAMGTTLSQAGLVPAYPRLDADVINTYARTELELFL